MSTEEFSWATLMRPEVRKDPYPVYARLQREAPVQFDPLSRSYFITRFDDVMTVVHDRTMSRARALEHIFARLPGEAQEPARPIQNFFGQMLLYADPPVHTRARALLNRAFTPKMVEQLRPEIVRLSETLLQDAVEKGNGSFDFVGDFAYLLPLRVVSKMLGVDLEHEARFRDWTLSIMAAMGMTKHSPELIGRTVATIGELSEYVGGIAERLRRHPDGSLMSALVASAESDALSMPEVVANAVLILIAGHETTTNLLGNALVMLAKEPHHIAKMREDESHLEAFSREIVRFDTSVQLTSRVSEKEIVLSGHTIPANSSLMLVLGAANRDPEQFERPDAFLPDRKELKDASFSAGIHVCLGAPLARLELTLALRTFVDRLPEFRLLSNEIEWRENPIYRGPKSLEVAVR